MRQVNGKALTLALVICGVVLWKNRPVSQPEPSEVTRTLANESAPRIQEEEAPLKVLATKQNVTSKAPPPALTHTQELTTYASLHRKVFLTDGENGQKIDLLKNAAVLRAMGVRLMQAAPTEEAAGAQNAAIELLLEALKIGDTKVAAEVLRGVVKDAQVEDTNLEMRARENLAGVKAEILYQWSAMIPSQSNELATLLPGPVSQKIWRNVVNAQASNIAESADVDP